MRLYKRNLKQFARTIKKIAKMKNKIFLLYGPLGAGKTTFVKYFIGNEVVSPTFSGCLEYDNAFHFDCYSSINYNLLLSAMESNKYIFIEWADYLKIPIAGLSIYLKPKYLTIQ